MANSQSSTTTLRLHCEGAVDWVKMRRYSCEGIKYFDVKVSASNNNEVLVVIIRAIFLLFFV